MPGATAFTFSKILVDKFAHINKNNRSMKNTKGKPVYSEEHTGVILIGFKIWEAR